MSCPTITAVQRAVDDQKCKCRNNKIGRWVTFTWTVTADEVPFRTGVAIHDGAQWMESEGLTGILGEHVYSAPLFLASGAYHWLPVILAPEDCRTLLATNKFAFEDPLIIQSCCLETDELIGNLRIFSVTPHEVTPDLDLTEELDRTGCLSVDEVVAELPQTECPAIYSWTSPGSLIDSTERISYPIQLPEDGSPVTITVQVTLPGCPPRAFTKVVQKCVEKKPKKVRPWWSFSWCTLLLVAGLILIFGGMILTTLGSLFASLVVCYSFLNIGAVIIFAISFVVAILGFICRDTGALFYVIWHFFCGGCDGTRSPNAFCEMQRKVRTVMLVIGTVMFVIRFIFVVAVLALTSPCNGVFPWFLNAAIYFIDLGVWGALLLFDEIYGNAIGCFNSLWWVPRLPPQNLPCLDDWL